jgi:hypothetical protein
LHPANLREIANGQEGSNEKENETGRSSAGNQSPRRAVPHGMDPSAKGFVMTFRGLTKNNEALDIQVECPLWWTDEIKGKLQPVLARQLKVKRTAGG